VAYESPSVDEVVETNPLDVVPTNDTDTDLTTTDNDDQAVVNVKAIVADDDDGDGDDLAYTGSDAVGLLGFGALALVAGGGLLLMRRRRSVD
jgi:LPXTG-motif cell wall-anchored protein